MKLSITKAAQTYLEQFNQPNTVFAIDLDDGTGPYSPELLENGLSYRFLIINAEKLPSTFKYEVPSDLGTLYATADTMRYLDENMKLAYLPNWNQLQLSSDAALLEANVRVGSYLN